MEAPLSSPSVEQSPQYFHGAQSKSPSQQQQYASQSQPAQSVNQQYQQAQPQRQQLAQTQNGANDANAALPFLRDFNLVAEAAKRAQMAVLMRDMEAVGLS